MTSSKITALTALTAPTSDDLLYIVDDPGGTPVSKKITLANLLYKTQTLTDQATITWDMSLGGKATVTIAGNRTLAAPTNLINGAEYWLYVIQGSGGSRLMTWNAVFKWPAATAPTLSTVAGKIDIVRFICDGTNLYGVAALAFA